MHHEYEATVAGISQTWNEWAALGGALDADGWATSTRCPGWDVAALFAHVSIFPVILAEASRMDTPPTGELLTAVDILRGFNQPDGVAYAMAEMTADRAVSDAASCAPADLATRFAVTGPKAVERLRAADPATVVPWPAAGPTTLAEGMRIVLLESVVHLLDAFRALGRPPQVPEAALRDTARLLAEMAPPVEFVEAATGRSGRSPLPVLR